MTRVHIDRGDITTCQVSAIVNAANNDLVLGSGVAGAIRQRGGPEIQEECDRKGPIRVGEAAITTAGLLPARHVIHQASMALGEKTTVDNLRTSTRAALKLADEHRLKSIAFPAVGTGVGGIRPRVAAAIMLDEVCSFIRGETSLEDIYFVLFDDETFQTFRDAYRDLGGR